MRRYMRERYIADNFFTMKNAIERRIKHRRQVIVK